MMAQVAHIVTQHLGYMGSCLDKKRTHLSYIVRYQTRAHPNKTRTHLSYIMSY